MDLSLFAATPCMFVAFSTETTPSGGIVVASYDVAAKNENCVKRSSSHPMTLQQENEISKYLLFRAKGIEFFLERFIISFLRINGVENG